jgi:hypothetical protein
LGDSGLLPQESSRDELEVVRREPKVHALT